MLVSFFYSKSRMQEAEAERFCHKPLTPNQGRTIVIGVPVFSPWLQNFPDAPQSSAGCYLRLEDTHVDFF